eukprot:gene2122-2613_t
MTGFTINNNQFYGSLDESHCRVFPVFANNSLTSNLPNCFICNLGNPRLRKDIFGNNFDNYKDNYIESQYPICDTSKIIIEPKSFYLGTNYLEITGTNLGFYPESMEFLPGEGPIGRGFNVKIPNSNFIGPPINYTRSMEIIKTGYFDLKFKYPNVVKRVIVTVNNPDITNIIISPFLNLGYTFTFIGIGFGTPDISVKVKLGNYPCSLSYHESHSISCTVFDSNIPDGEYIAYLTIGDQNFQKPFMFVRSYPLIYAIDAPPNKGGDATFYGNFGNYTDYEGTILQVNGTDVPILSINSTTIITRVGPGTGVLTIYLNIKGNSYTNSFYYKEEDKCFKNCNGNGRCLSGNCFCNPGYGGPVCELKGDFNVGVNRTDNSTQIIKDNVKFDFSVTSLQEVSINMTVIRELVFDKWKLETQSSTKWSYTFDIDKENNESITYVIEEFKERRTVEFAGTTMEMEPGTIKMSVFIYNWSFMSSLNGLRLVIRSFVTSTEKCSSKSQVESSGTQDTLNYITIEKDGKMMYGRFLDKALSNGKPTYSSTKILKQDEDSVFVGISLPHCNVECILDPDFSLLLVDKKNQCETAKKEWLVPTVVVLTTWYYFYEEIKRNEVWGR